MKSVMTIVSLVFISSTVFAGNNNFRVGEKLILKTDMTSHYNVSVLTINSDQTLDLINRDEKDKSRSVLKGINASNLAKPIKSINGVSAGDRVVSYGNGHMEVTVTAVYSDATADLYYAAENYTYKGVNISTLHKPLSSFDGFAVGSVVKMKFSDGLEDDMMVLAVYEDGSADVLYLKNDYVYENVDLKSFKKN